MDYRKYQEVKPHYLKMVLWRVLNATLFPLLPRFGRGILLRLFGARVGKKGVVYRSARVYAPWNLTIDEGVVIGPRVEIYNKDPVSIGDMAVVSQDVFLCTASHDVNSRSIALATAPIVLGAQTWIAARAIVLPGVTVGEGAVVGAGAVVANDVESWTVVGGNPAREIKKRRLK